MVRAKNYETMSKFVEVMPWIPWLFCRTRCTSKWECLSNYDSLRHTQKQS